MSKLTILNVNISKLLSVAILLLPIINMYVLNSFINNVSVLASLIILLVMCYILALDKFKIVFRVSQEGIRFTQYNFIIVTLMLFSMLLNYNVGFHFNTWIVAFIICCIFLGVSCRYVDLDYLKKVYYIICIIAALYLLLQFVVYRVFGVILPSNLLPLETQDLANTIEEYNLFNRLRLQSFFSEPSTFAEYILPCYVLTVYNDNMKRIKKILSVFLFSFSILLSTSFLGIACLCIINLTYIFFKYNTNRTKILCYTGLLIIVISLVVNHIPYIKDVVYDFLETGIYSSKSAVRVFRGFSLYFQLPFYLQLFGTGIGNGYDYMQMYSISTAFESQWREVTEYFNGIASSFIYGGFIVGTMFIKSPFLFYTTETKKTLAILVSAICLSGSIFYNMMFLVYGVIMLSESVESGDRL